MNIQLDQVYEIDNVISRSGRFTVPDFQAELMAMEKLFKAYGVNNGELVITTTRAMEFVNNEQILDVEILLPVTSRVSCEKPYEFKKNIKIVNALYARENEVSNLQNTLNEINQYILDNELQPITSAYLVQSKEENMLVTDIYIGINPNIL